MLILRRNASLVLLPENYILPEGVYYIKVSAAEGEAFSHGSYTLLSKEPATSMLILRRNASLVLLPELEPISECNLGTYIDPQTNKTVDEGLSFVHNQASAQNYAIRFQLWQ